MPALRAPFISNSLTLDNFQNAKTHLLKKVQIQASQQLYDDSSREQG
jgi:hypothetical protein